LVIARLRVKMSELVAKIRHISGTVNFSPFPATAGVNSFLSHLTQTRRRLLPTRRIKMTDGIKAVNYVVNFQ
jgi:hypothetical protein